MASHAPISLPYEVSTTFYPRLMSAPRWLLVLFAVIPWPVGLIAFAAVQRSTPFADIFGSVYAGASVLVLIGLTLLFIPCATWLRVSETGITYSVAFYRRHVPWKCAREVRLVLFDGWFSPEQFVEVVFDRRTTKPRGAWLEWIGFHDPGCLLIEGHLFGWPADELKDVMDTWRARGGHSGASRVARC